MEYLPQIRDYVAHHGYLTRVEVDTQHMDASWQATHKKAQDLLAVDPNYLPNTYLKYYLYPDYVVAHSDPEYTRANEVEDGREKRVFTAAQKIIDAVLARSARFQSTVTPHLSWILPVQLPLIHMNACCSLWKIMAQSPILMTTSWWKCLVSSERWCRTVNARENSIVSARMILNQAMVEKLVVDGWIHHDYQELWQALTLSKTLPSAQVAKEVLDDLIVANREYWPELRHADHEVHLMSESPVSES